MTDILILFLSVSNSQFSQWKMNHSVPTCTQLRSLFPLRNFRALASLGSLLLEEPRVS